MITALIIFLIGLAIYLIGRSVVTIRDGGVRRVIQIFGIIIMVIGGVYFVLAILPAGDHDVDVHSSAKMVAAQLD